MNPSNGSRGRLRRTVASPRRPRRALWITTVVLIVLALEMGYTYLLLSTGSSPAAAIWIASALSTVTLGIVRGIISLIRAATSLDDGQHTDEHDPEDQDASAERAPVLGPLEQADDTGRDNIADSGPDHDSPADSLSPQPTAAPAGEA